MFKFHVLLLATLAAVLPACDERLDAPDFRVAQTIAAKTESPDYARKLIDACLPSVNPAVLTLTVMDGEPGAPQDFALIAEGSAPAAELACMWSLLEEWAQ